jgi:putative ABC transport system ATP-binding protein
MQPIVTCVDVSHEFPVSGGRLKVLHEVSLEVYPGQLTMLVGPSGCGKTTLISLIAGLLRHSQGTVSILGRDLSRFTETELLQFRLDLLGFVFQQYNLLLGLTAAENAALPLVANKIPWPAAMNRAQRLLDQLGLAAHADKLPRQLSGGQQQRVAIARALVHEPRLLLCDEPTAALDSHSGQVVIQLLKGLAVRADSAAIVVTHDPRIYRYADRIVHMEDGRIREIEEVHAADSADSQSEEASSRASAAVLG